jgi:hypothetical protein
MAIQGSDMRLTLPNVRLSRDFRLAKALGIVQGLGTSLLDNAASRPTRHPVAEVCLPRLNITCHILRCR